MNELWVGVLGLESIYQVSCFGRLKVLMRERKGRNGCKIINKERILKPINIEYTEYVSYEISVDGNRRIVKAHREAAKAFIPNSENKPYVNHKDGNKLNNNIDNLEWVTAKENVSHAWATGLNKVYPHQKLILQSEAKKRIGRIPKNARIIINYETGIFYESIEEAANAHNINYTVLVSWLRGQNRNRSMLAYA